MALFFVNLNILLNIQNMGLCSHFSQSRILFDLRLIDLNLGFAALFLVLSETLICNFNWIQAGYVELIIRINEIGGKIWNNFLFLKVFLLLIFTLREVKLETN